MRKAKVERKTKETDIVVTLNVDGSGKSAIRTPIPFLTHMLELLATHGLFDITLKAKGDIEVDYHHTVEDVGICLGECFKKALGTCKGIRRYGDATVPMDESLSSVVLDICDRPHLVFNTPLVSTYRGRVRKSVRNRSPRQSSASSVRGTRTEFDSELVKEFFKAFALKSGIALHINVSYGENTHHVIEAIFKAFARALDMASTVDERIKGVMSTKGTLKG